MKDRHTPGRNSAPSIPDNEDSMFVRWGKKKPAKSAETDEKRIPGAETGADPGSETAAEEGKAAGKDPIDLHQTAGKTAGKDLLDLHRTAEKKERTRSVRTQKTAPGAVLPRAVLAGCNTGTGAEKYAREIAELRGLAKACGLDPVAAVIQNADAITHATYLGSGKVVELRREIEQLDADIVLFNEALTPMQMRNLEKELDTEVLDRTGLILQIFSSRARTREAKLQVESAQLQYMLPRLVGMRAELSRQGGGSGRLSNKGAGEQKLELDRRRIEKRISELRRELEVVDRERATQRSRRLRTGLTRVALVGYTNAGKSTIMNALLDYCAAPPETGRPGLPNTSVSDSDTGRVSAAAVEKTDRESPAAVGKADKESPAAVGKADKGEGLRKKESPDNIPGSAKKVFQADMLFATLDTAVRRIDAPGHLPFLLSDTVGFVNDLPHALVKAFRSTLEEVRCADLLLEVVDFSDPDYRGQIEVTARTLEEIGAGHIPVVYLYNKTDLAMEEPADRPVPVRIPFRRGEILFLAAGKGIGIPEILDLIDSALGEGRAEREFLIPYTRGSVLQEIRTCGVLLSEDYLPEGIRVKARCRKEDLRRLQRMLEIE